MASTTRNTSNKPNGGLEALRTNWPMVATLLVLSLTAGGAWYSTQTQIALQDARIARAEHICETMPVNYVPRETMNLHLLNLERELKRQSEDLREIKAALGVISHGRPAGVPDDPGR
jgi:hypothetical protein